MLSYNVKRNSPFTTPTHEPHKEPADKDHHLHQGDNLSTGMQNVSVNATNKVQNANLVKKLIPLSDPNAIDTENVFSEDDEITIKNITAAHDNEENDNNAYDQKEKSDSYEQDQELHRSIAIKTPYQAVADDDKEPTHDIKGEHGETEQQKEKEGKEEDTTNYPKCAQCGLDVRHSNAPQTINGPLHSGCVMEYRFVHQPRCKYCDVRFRDEEAATYVKDPETGYLYHPECASKQKDGIVFVRPSIEGYVRKQGIARRRLAVRSWKTRYFILNPEQNGIKYYKSDPSGRTTAESAAKAENNENNSDSENDNDEENNNPGVSEEERKVNEIKLNKGSVPLDDRSRLITQPFMSLYSPISSMLPSTKELLIIFRDPPESDVERQLLFECQDTKDKHRWMRALETYIHVVDDPGDYKYKPASKRQTN